MINQRLLVTLIVAIVALLLLDALVSRYWQYLPNNGWVSTAVVFGVLGYMIVTIASRGRLRLPSLPRRRRMRVVRRDPTASAADFIRQFEDRTKR
ncbi:MAG TPA: hypothetical protein VGD01_09965 [Candidatus Elarobacter sp.]